MKKGNSQLRYDQRATLRLVALVFALGVPFAIGLIVSRGNLPVQLAIAVVGAIAFRLLAWWAVWADEMGR